MSRPAEYSPLRGSRGDRRTAIQPDGIARVIEDVRATCYTVAGRTPRAKEILMPTIDWSYHRNG
jgi:hypothetical protein